MTTPTQEDGNGDATFPIMHEAFERFCAELRELAKTEPEKATALLPERFLREDPRIQISAPGFPWMVVLTHSISGADHLNSGTRCAVNPLLTRPRQLKPPSGNGRGSLPCSGFYCVA
jgi:hypothetical protein